MSDGALRLYEDASQEDLRRLGDDRDNFQRDRDLILYSSALQRLGTTTQVVSAESGHVFHNRLTHTLQVAQVGRRLAEKLITKNSGLASELRVNPDVVESACLAHDLGHPPFGHLAEEILNELAGEDVQGFEGNAQSFRIVTQLAFRAREYDGLNLTDRTLRAILKYPWTYSGRPHDKRNKWGAYDTEYDSFRLAVGGDGPGPFPRSAEAELMDWADDLTYAIHDAEDFYRAGLIPLHMLVRGERGDPRSRERDRFLEYVSKKKNQLNEIKDCTDSELDDIFAQILLPYFTLSGAYQGTRDDRARLRVFTSQLVGRYINGLELQKPDPSGTVVRANHDFKKELALLKQLTWYYVIEAPGLAVQQHAQRIIIKYLFHTFLEEARQLPARMIPPYYRERLQRFAGDQYAARRVVTDLIAGMSESQAFTVYQRLKGISNATVLDGVMVN